MCLKLVKHPRNCLFPLTLSYQLSLLESIPDHSHVEIFFVRMHIDSRAQLYHAIFKFDATTTLAAENR